ncbi:hypothetical protein PUN28_017561 [Cardiocondyla obscurior]|uniref:Uncharacterized protein n=1 Tax=Cardiocondyla obscurior TaxID=286306 RepID=A0AAW2ELY8_9HYME
MKIQTTCSSLGVYDKKTEIRSFIRVCKRRAAYPSTPKRRSLDQHPPPPRGMSRRKYVADLECIQVKIHATLTNNLCNINRSRSSELSYLLDKYCLSFSKNYLLCVIVSTEGKKKKKNLKKEQRW